MLRPRIVAIVSCFLQWAAVLAHETVILEASDARIHYVTGNNPDTSQSTWETRAPSPSTCDDPQQLTERVGDYAAFTFTGTDIFIIGTIGQQRGILGFSLDGQNVTFDRTRVEGDICSYVLFQRTELKNQQHTIVISLVEKQSSLSAGPRVGQLSLQRIRYITPDGDSSLRNIPIIIGASVGGGCILAAILGVLIFIRRRRTQTHNTAPFFDTDDVPARPRGAANPLLPSGTVATPFRWSLYTQQERHRPTDPEMTQIAPLPPAAAQPNNHHVDSYFGSPLSGNQLLLRTTLSDPSPHTSSMQRRDSQLARRDSKASYYTSNPDSHITPVFDGIAADDVLADRIAFRLANMMDARAGSSRIAAAPPLYQPTEEDAGERELRSSPVQSRDHNHGSMSFELLDGLPTPAGSVEGPDGHFLPLSPSSMSGHSPIAGPSSAMRTQNVTPFSMSGISSMQTGVRSGPGSQSGHSMREFQGEATSSPSDPSPISLSPLPASYNASPLSRTPSMSLYRPLPSVPPSQSTGSDSR